MIVCQRKCSWSKSKWSRSQSTEVKRNRLLRSLMTRKPRQKQFEIRDKITLFRKKAIAVTTCEASRWRSSIWGKTNPWRHKSTRCIKELHNKEQRRAILHNQDNLDNHQDKELYWPMYNNDERLIGSDPVKKKKERPTNWRCTSK